MACPTSERIRELLETGLPEEESDQLWEHITNCESCQGEIEQWEDQHPMQPPTPEEELLIQRLIHLPPNWDRDN